MKIPVRMIPSTSQNSQVVPSCPLIRLVRPTGTTKKRPIAKTTAMTTAPVQTPEETSADASPIARSAEIASARIPIASEPHRATTPRMTGSRATGPGLR